jgi:hypothetical protein
MPVCSFTRAASFSSSVIWYVSLMSLSCLLTSGSTLMPTSLPFWISNAHTRRRELRAGRVAHQAHQLLRINRRARMELQIDAAAAPVHGSTPRCASVFNAKTPPIGGHSPAAPRSGPPTRSATGPPARARRNRRSACRRAGAAARRRCTRGGMRNSSPRFSVEWTSGRCSPRNSRAVSSSIFSTSRSRRCHVPVLFAAQQVARPAQFQIERGDLEARAEVREFLQRRQPLPRDSVNSPSGGTSR